MGKVIASYDVKITLRENEGEPLDVWTSRNQGEGDSGPEPKIDDLTGLIESALYDDLPYFTHDAINVTATRTDE